MEKAGKKHGKKNPRKVIEKSWKNHRKVIEK